MQTASGKAGEAAEDPLEQRENWLCEIARTKCEREAAFRLIYNAYVRAGLGVENPFGLRVTPFHLLPSTTIFIARLLDKSQEIFATVSLVGDGAFGLPLERVYPAEVNDRREQGLSLAEVSCLADRRSDFRRFFPVFCALNRVMIQFARAEAFDQVLVAVHPKHARFYTRYMGFEAIGGLTSYPSVCDRPAVALCYDFAKNDLEPFPYYERFFGEPIPASELLPAAMPHGEIEYFGRMVDPAFSLAGAAALAETD